MWARCCGCSWGQLGSCCSLPAPMWRTCCWCGPKGASRNWQFARPWGPVGRGWRANCCSRVSPWDSPAAQPAWPCRLLIQLGPASLPRLDEISIDLPALLFTLAISLAAGLLFGVIPVFKYAGPRLSGALRQGGRNASQGRERHRARSVLVVVQVALALVLLISSGLMIRTLVALKRVPPGFTDPAAILTLRVSIPGAQMPNHDQVIQADREILRRMRSIPGVTSVGLTNSVTMDGYTDNDPIYAEGHVYSESQIPALRRYKQIAPGLFRTMGNPLLAGRDLTWTDITERLPVVLVSENLAREFWGSAGAALGKRETPKGRWREVVGVVGNERDDGVDQKATAIVYWPIARRDFWGEKEVVDRDLCFVVRSRRTGSAGFLKEVQQAVWSVNPNLTIANVRTVQEIYERSMARTSFTFVLLTIAAGMALLLGVVGIYGVISYSISQRTREIGIRVALGAQQRQVRGMFVRYALTLTGIGHRDRSGVRTGGGDRADAADVGSAVRHQSAGSAHLRGSVSRVGSGGIAGGLHSGASGHGGRASGRVAGGVKTDRRQDRWRSPIVSREDRRQKTIVCPTVLRHRAGIERREGVGQAPVFGPGFTAPGHLENEVEEMPAHFFDGGLSGGDAAGIDIDQVVPLLRQGGAR
ncbi:membrane hypothetical protein [Candidatus Sulfopaludibacter sp. SbA3]|nr:membrane hypothetical protein [Candidatus Sulfopaludibacter sp. SbA3]